MNAGARVVLEIRSYRLKAGGAERLGALLDGDVGALLRDFGIRLVRHGSSLHDEQSYVLIRAFDSLAQRDELEERFYGSAIWREHYRENVLSLIETYQDVVLEVEASVVEGMVSGWR